MASMLVTGEERAAWLRPVQRTGERDAGPARGGQFERGGRVVRGDLRLGQILRGRPPGITGHQWSCAMRAQLAYVACDAGTGAPALAVQLRGPVPGGTRDDRMTDAVCAAVGLPLLRVESTTLAARGYARRLVEYVLDAHAFTEAIGDGPGYRELTGRLPDGRTGFVNDLSVLARAAAVDLYAARQVADPTIRGLHVRWADGVAEGWAWLDMPGGGCVFERVRVWERRFSCGVQPAQLAEDLAAAAIGEWLKRLDTEAPPLCSRTDLAWEFRHLRLRRDEMRDEFRYDHVTFD